MAPKSKSKTNRGSRESSADVPRLLAQVLQAIADMEQNHGCTTRQIVTQLKSINVRTSPTSGKVRPQRLVVQVQRALRHGVNAGLLEENAGRYVIVPKEEPAKQRTGRGENQNRGKRRRSPSKSVSKSTQGGSTDRSPSSNDASSHDRSRSRTKRRKRTKRNPKKQRKDTKKRRSSLSSSKSRSRNHSKAKKTSHPNQNSDGTSTQQQNEDALPSKSYSYGRQKCQKRCNRDVRQQQIEEDEVCIDKNKDVETPECGSPDYTTQEPRESDQLPEPEPDPDPEHSTERISDYIS